MARPLGNLQEECFNQEVVFTSRSARNKRVECGDSKVTKKNPALHTTVRDGHLVPGVRLELTRFYPADFESAASTIPPPGETSRKEDVEVYQLFAKKAMDCEGSLQRTAAIHSPSVRPSRTKSSPVRSASGTRTKSRPVILGCGIRSSGSSLVRSS